MFHFNETAYFQNNKKKKNFSRMQTTCSLTVHASAGSHQMSELVGSPPVKKLTYPQFLPKDVTNRGEALACFPVQKGVGSGVEGFPVRVGCCWG